MASTHNDGKQMDMICSEGIKETFLHNPPLLQMLKAMHPKTLVEATLDTQWGTGVHLRDPNVLKKREMVWNWLDVQYSAQHS